MDSPKILGREITPGKSGLPDKLSSYFTREMTRLKEDKEEILSQPIQCEVRTTGGAGEWGNSPLVIVQE